MNSERSQNLPLLVIIFVVVVLGILSVHTFPTDTLDVGYHTFEDPEKLEYARSIDPEKETYKKFGSSASLISTDDGSEQIAIDGYITLQFQANNLTVLSETIVGFLPAFFSEEHEHAFVLGLASGITAGAATQAYKDVTVAEISPAILPIAEEFADDNFSVMDNPNAHVVVQDGVFALLENDETYDAIINTVPSPRFFAANKLWTEDFFDAVSLRLADGGVFVGWVGRNMQMEGFKIINNTLRESFADCRYIFFETNYLGFICGNEKLTFTEHTDDSWPSTIRERFASHLQDMKIHTFLRNLLLHPAPINAVTTHTLTNTLDLPRLEFMNFVISNEETLLLKFVIESSLLDPITGTVLPEGNKLDRCGAFASMQPYFLPPFCEE